MSVRVWTFSLTIGLAGCGVEQLVEVEGAPCPCAEGQSCCALTQQCVANGLECPEPVELDSITPSVGASLGGYELRLAGQGLQLASAVEVGGEACEILRVEEDASLICRAPQGPAWGGPAEVRILDGAGQTLYGSAEVFRYAELRFVEQAENWGFRRSNQGAGVSLFRLGLDDEPWIFFGTDLYADQGLGRPILAKPDLWRPAAGGYERAEAGVLTEMSTFVPADFDNDGRLEAVGAWTFPLVGGALSMLELSGEGTVTPQEIDLDDYQHFLPIDVDGDHDVDLLGCEGFRLGTPLAILRNDGSGRFSRETYSITNTLGCKSMQVGDVDGDLIPEVFVGSGGRPVLFALRNGELIEVSDDWRLRATLESVPFSTSMAHFVDVDRDGDVDLALVGEGRVDVQGESNGLMRQSGLLLFRNQLVGRGERRFEPVGRLDLPGPDYFDCPIDFQGVVDSSLRWGVGTSVWFDADLDGDPDVLLPAPSGRCIFGPSLYLNRVDEGREGFTLMALATDRFQLAPRGGVAGDIDGDGDLDVLLNHRQLGARSALINQIVDEAGASVRGLVVRPVTDPDGDATDDDQGDDRLEPSVVVQLDIDGDDFAVDDGLQTQVTGAMRSASSHGLYEAHFGLGSHEGPVWVRARFPDGSIVTRQVMAEAQTVELRDCAEARCP